MNRQIENIRKFYDAVYHKTAAPYSAVPKHLTRLVSRIKICEKQRLLDVGCGTGEWLWACNKIGVVPYGIDLSEKAINVCRAVMPNGTFVVQPAETLPFENTFFDVVSCLGSLEHFVDSSATLKEMVRVAKSDAKFLFSVPNADFLTRRLGLYSGTDQLAAKEEVLSLKEWAGLFDSCGLTVRERWPDLHVLSWKWISNRGAYAVPIRAAQALALVFWPLKWQYQVYHLCVKK